MLHLPCVEVDHAVEDGAVGSAPPRLAFRREPVGEDIVPGDHRGSEEVLLGREISVQSAIATPERSETSRIWMPSGPVSASISITAVVS